MGQRVASLLASHFGTMERLEAATYEDLLAIPDVGERIADSVVTFLSQPLNKEVIANLKSLGLKMIDDTISGDQDGSQKVLSGQSIVVTGSFVQMPRKIWKRGLRNSVAR